MPRTDGLQGMKEVRRLASIFFLLFAFGSFLFVPFSRADVCVSPRIKRASACGVVIDPYGMKVPGATVAFGADGSKFSTVSDIHGRFSIASSGDEVRLQVNAPGFQSVETSVGRLKEPSAHCKKPLLVMLTIGAQGCAMISLRKSDLLLAKKD